MNAPDLAPEAGLLSRLKASLVGRLSLLLLQWGIPLLLLAVIGHRLTELGWRQIWQARPANPGFYLLLVHAVLPSALGRLSGLSQSVGRKPPAAGGDPAQAADEQLHAGLFRRGLFLSLGQAASQCFARSVGACHQGFQHPVGRRGPCHGLSAAAAAAGQRRPACAGGDGRPCRALCAGGHGAADPVRHSGAWATAS